MPRERPSTTATPAPKATGSSASARGKALRRRVPRSSHGEWKAPANRPDPIELLQRGDAARLHDLLPMRYGRMSTSPFAFFRGAAAIMASDLQFVPSTGLRVQIAGDAHVSNFGVYATPERRVAFDLNDFDETAQGPWEWDLKRFCASVWVGARTRRFRRSEAEVAVRAAAASYRERMAEYATMPVLDIWYARIDQRVLAQAAPHAFEPGHFSADKPGEMSDRLLPRYCADDGGGLRIVDHAPRIFHAPDAAAFAKAVRSALGRYARTLSGERRELLGRFRLVDVAYKVVGIGSVGTRCGVVLLVARDDDVFFLQMKEAMESAYAPYVGPGEFANQGERVVAGQRLMQAASDPFLGWTKGDDGRFYYVRQLFDMKGGVDLAVATPAELARYASLCGWALARAHAKGGGIPAEIAGYLGTSELFDDAMVSFANAYADQNERDYEELMAAIKAGRVAARPGV